MLGYVLRERQRVVWISQELCVCVFVFCFSFFVFDTGELLRVIDILQMNTGELGKYFSFCLFEGGWMTIDRRVEWLTDIAPSFEYSLDVNNHRVYLVIYVSSKFSNKNPSRILSHCQRFPMTGFSRFYFVIIFWSNVGMKFMLASICRHKLCYDWPLNKKNT